MTSALATLAAQFVEQNHAGKLLLPNAWDAASARIFEEAGFEAIGTTSAGIAYAHGFQDGERLGRAAMVRAVATIVRAVSCPVTADVEAGYGSGPGDVARTVAAVLDAGAVGINLEDGRPGSPGSGGCPLFEPAEQCRRIGAAREVAARCGVPLVINARTDTFLLGLGADLDERIALTVERGTRYLEAGADLVFVPLLVDPPVVSRLAGPLQGRLSLMALPGAPAAEELFQAGAARVSLGQMAMLATLGALQEIADDLRQRGSWKAIERTFYGFDEAEALFAGRG